MWSITLSKKVLKPPKSCPQNILPKKLLTWIHRAWCIYIYIIHRIPSKYSHHHPSYSNISPPEHVFHYISLYFIIFHYISLYIPYIQLYIFSPIYSIIYFYRTAGFFVLLSISLAPVLKDGTEKHESLRFRTKLRGFHSQKTHDFTMKHGDFTITYLGFSIVMGVPQ